MIRSSIAWALIISFFLLSSTVQAREEPGSRPEQTQKQSAAGVTVKVSLVGKGDTITVEVALDTHTVGLDGYTFGEIVVLRTGDQEYPAKVISQDGSGHHRSAVIEFKDPGTKNVEIVVKDVGGVKERSFRF